MPLDPLEMLNAQVGNKPEASEVSATESTPTAQSASDVDAAAANTDATNSQVAATAQDQGMPVSTDPAIQSDSLVQADAIVVDSEEDLKALEYVRKVLGREDIKTVQDLKNLNKPAAAPEIKPEASAEDVKEMERRFQNDAMKYGLDKNIFDTKILASFNVDKAKSSDQIAFTQYRDEILQLDPDLAARFQADPSGAGEEIREMFEDTFFLNEEPTSAKYKLGQKNIQNIATNYLETTYEKIIGVEDAFRSELETQQRAVAYKRSVEEVVSSQPERLSIQIGDKEYTYTIPENTRKDAKDQLLSEAVFNSFGAVADKAALSSAFTQQVFSKEWPKMVAEVAKAYHADQVEGLRLGRLNVPVDVSEGGTTQLGAATTTTTGVNDSALQLLNRAMGRVAS